MKSKITGELIPCNYDEELYESEPIAIPYFDGKELKVGFVEAKYEPYLNEADEVLEKFLNLDIKSRQNDSEMVHDYYAQVLKNGFCEKLKLSSVTDIWNFVIPNEIIIDWEEKGRFFLCVSCGCSWEEEHGLQLVFKNGENLIRAAGHDGHYEN